MKLIVNFTILIMIGSWFVFKQTLVDFINIKYKMESNRNIRNN